MKHTTQIALAVALLAAAAGCRKDNKAAQLKALDNAYRAGIYTKEEYDAKKLAVLGPPAAPPAPVPAAAPTPPTAASAPPSAAPAPPGASPSVPTPPVEAPTSAPSVPARPPAPRSGAIPSPPRIPKPPSVPEAHIPAPPAIPASQAPEPPPARPETAQPEASAAPPVEEPAERAPAPLAGCESTDSKAGGPNGVQERFFPASEDAVRKAAALALTNLDFTVSSDSNHEMQAAKKGRLKAIVGAGSEKVVLHFASTEKDGQSGTRVTGETKKGVVGRVTQKSWTDAVLSQIGCNLRNGRN